LVQALSGVDKLLFTKGVSDKSRKRFSIMLETIVSGRELEFVSKNKLHKQNLEVASDFFSRKK